MSKPCLEIGIVKFSTAISLIICDNPGDTRPIIVICMTWE
jgi:hypothetical protein